MDRRRCGVSVGCACEPRVCADGGGWDRDGGGWRAGVRELRRRAVGRRDADHPPTLRRYSTTSAISSVDNAEAFGAPTGARWRVRSAPWAVRGLSSRSSRRATRTSRVWPRRSRSGSGGCCGAAASSSSARSARSRTTARCYCRAWGSVQRVGVMGSAVGRSLRRPGRRAHVELAPVVKRRCAEVNGFSLHADVCVPARDRAQLERLVR